jgi:hypothetical protein
LATPEPVKVDIGVRLDIYQKTPPAKANAETSSLQIAAGRRLRSGEIQQLKNDRVVGEDRDGSISTYGRRRPTRNISRTRRRLLRPKTPIDPYYIWRARKAKASRWN